MIPQALFEFLSSDHRNQWLNLPYGEIYIRNTQRFLEDERRRTLDLANITITKSERGKGHFKRLLDDLENGLSRHGIKAIYIECVLEPLFLPFFEKRGYKYDPHTTENSFYKLLEPK